MRKFLSCLVVMLLSLQVFAQRNDYSYRLSTIVSDDGRESTDYSYDSEDLTKVTSVHILSDFEEDGYEFIDSMFYDNEGHILTMEEHQFLDGQWIFPNYVAYTYNEMGLRATRKNYNDWGTGFEIGGTYSYYYDENGNQTYWELEMSGMIFQRAEFTYNEDNLLACELGLMSNFSGGYENSYKIEYSYTEDNYIKLIDEYYWDNGSWFLNSTKQYTYDELGNCITCEVKSGNTVVRRDEYLYDETMLAEDVYYFEHPESNYPVYPHMYNALSVDKFYTIDANSGQLVYICDYTYFYDEIFDAVEETSMTSNIYPNPTSDFVNIDAEGVDVITVYDALGRVIYASDFVDATFRIDMREYVSGIYFVKLQGKSGVSVMKIMKD
ncbi:MAG: T9SS type A sorting domain-containing protein [Lentimicrobiaceae bacterium]|nr:T9SS type A sorting domain-containing protein [Lentimicrobiaceae bacterium]